MCLDRNWNMWIPGFGSEDLRPYKKAPATEAHKQVSTIHYFTLKLYSLKIKIKIQIIYFTFLSR